MERLGTRIVVLDAASKAEFLVRPEPGLFKPPVAIENPVDLKRDYKHRGLQVIVKMEDIYLPKDRSCWWEGKWRAEGTMVRFASLTNPGEGTSLTHELINPYRMNIYALQQSITTTMRTSIRAVSSSNNRQMRRKPRSYETIKEIRPGRNAYMGLEMRVSSPWQLYRTLALSKCTKAA